MHDSWFFVGVIVFIFLVWIVTGGPGHQLAYSGPTLAEPGQLGGGTYLSFPHAGSGTGGIGTSNVVLPGSSNGASAPSTSSYSLSNVSFGESSPYRGTVSLYHYVSGAGIDPQTEYVQLAVSGSAAGPVDITGWTLESVASGNTSTIPKGTAVPMSGLINASQDIVLNPGERADIVSGRSPIGASFRENKCIGYFSSFQTFTPSLPQNCPDPKTDLQNLYSGNYIGDVSCIDYVNTLQRCQPVLSPPTTVSGACQTFLQNTLNYNGCVAAHRNDPDFNGTVWHVYLGRTAVMWRAQHEVVKLLDANGKTVDMFSY